MKHCRRASLVVFRCRLGLLLGAVAAAAPTACQLTAGAPSEANAPVNPAVPGSGGRGSGGSPGQSGQSGQAGQAGTPAGGGGANVPGASGGSGGAGNPDLGGGPGGDDAGAADAGAPDGPSGETGPLARDVTITLVEGSQAVFVPIAKAGVAVPAAMRKADLIEGRPLFVRVHLGTAAGFAARSLHAVLTASSDAASGAAVAPLVLREEKPIAGASKSTDINSSFNFLLPATAVLPSTKINVAVYEIANVGVGAGGGEAAAANPPRFPEKGEAELGIKAGKMELDLVIVRATGVNGALMDTPAKRKRVEDYLADVYPVQKLNVRWREPASVLAKKIRYTDGFNLLSQLRSADAAKPHEYYHLLVGVEDTNETLLGIAQVASASADDGARRIAMTFVRDRAIDSELDSISHEMGHNHGQGHVAGCGAQGIDAKYPYPKTNVGVDGYSLSEKAFKPSAKYVDLMGYCYPTWISDYTYQSFAKRVRAVSALAPQNAGGQTSALASRSLQGFLADDATSAPAAADPVVEAPLWSVVAGNLVAPAARPTAQRWARIFLRQGAQIDAAVSVRGLSEEVGGKEIAVSLPPSGDIAKVEINVDGRRYTLDAEHPALR